MVIEKDQKGRLYRNREEEGKVTQRKNTNHQHQWSNYSYGGKNEQNIWSSRG